ncbi:unnamed protein product [Sphenostylis stenocarpa]|uniref:Sec20 C-terminal domain-containing protein n=1 Tax=Sphenostylis stenocarpa TaxID=92480 RepID=A0AA86SK21_9FABA|nr:unnamed protein product [Sphenostylis stenocarpa]
MGLTQFNLGVALFPLFLEFTFDMSGLDLYESTGVLKKTESEYKGHRSLLWRTRNLLSVMQRQDVMDRKVTAEAIKAGMVGQAGLRPQAVADDLNFITSETIMFII